VYVGKATNYFDRIGVVEVDMETGTLQVGDDILIIGPTTGVIETKVKELRVDEVNVESAVKGDRVSFPVGEVVRRSDKLYKLISTSSA